MQFAKPFMTIDTAIRKLRAHLGAKGSFLILLLFPAGFGVFLFGFPAFLVLLISVVTCSIAGISLQIFAGKPYNIFNPGSIITGLLIGLTLGATTPVYMIVVGGFVAEYLGKYTFKKMKHNILNPAVLGRSAIAILEGISPSSYESDIVTGASVLAKDFGGMSRPDIIIDALFGFSKGAIGETSAFILIITGIILLRYVVIKWEAPVAMIITVPLAVLALPPSIEIVGHAPWIANPLMYLLGGSTFLSAFFFATDPVTTPKTRFGGILFGVGAGVLGVYGTFYTQIRGCEMFGILIMNILTPLLNKVTTVRDKPINDEGLPEGLGQTPSPLKDKAQCASKAYGTMTFYQPKDFSNRVKSTNFLNVEMPSFDKYSEKESFFEFKKLLKKKNRKQIVKTIEKSGLLGCGGAAFPVHKKWEFVCNHKTAPVLVVNGMEGESETFKDFVLMKKYPEILVEGVAIAALAIKPSQIYIVINSRYKECLSLVKQAVNEFNEQFQSDVGFNILVISGPDPELYICGEESALINFLESNRGEPRIKPPFPVNKGLWGKPTAIHNVETLSWIPLIFSDKKMFDGKQTRKLISLSGVVKHIGVYEVSFGMSLLEIIKMGGELPSRDAVKAISVGGVSGGILPASCLFLAFDNDTLKEAGAMVGAGAIKAFSESTKIFNEVLKYAKFFEQENCGRCTPCRMGTQELVRFVEMLISGEASKKDVEWIKGVMETMTLTSMCGLGKAAPSPLVSMFRYWPEEIEARLVENRAKEEVKA